MILPDGNADKDERYYLEMIEHFYRLGIQPDWWNCRR